MAPLLSEEEAAIDPYLVLQVETTATEQEVRKSYRKLSLKYHPDRNPSPDAVPKFREISLALELLLDPSKRAHLTEKREAERRKKARYADLDKKRKAMVDALNEREEEAKRARGQEGRRREEEREEERVKREGREMLERAQKRRDDEAREREQEQAKERERERERERGEVAAQRAQRQQKGKTNGHALANGRAAAPSEPLPPIAPTDLTLVLQLPVTYPTTTSASLQAVLSAKYGPVAHLILSAPPVAPEGKKKKPKGAKAVVEFAKGNWGGCWACWKDHQGAEGEGPGAGLGGTKARWAGGEEPAWVAWAGGGQGGPGEAAGTDGSTAVPLNGDAVAGSHAPQSRTTALPAVPNPFSNAAPFPSFASAPDFGPQGTTMAGLLAQHRAGREQVKAEKEKRDEFESMTLLRMRQRERERLEEQIRREEAEEA